MKVCGLRRRGLAAPAHRSPEETSPSLSRLPLAAAPGSLLQATQQCHGIETAASFTTLEQAFVRPAMTEDG